MKLRAWFWACLFIPALTGCAGGYGPVYGPDQTCMDFRSGDLCKIAYHLTDVLIKNVQVPLSLDQTVLVSSLVDVNNVERTSNFGRMLAEQIGSRLAQNGYMVVEVKLRESLYVKEREGEFLLSRRLKDIRTAHNAQGVVVGTYLVTPNDLYISARIVSAQDARIISSCDVKIPLTEDLKATLW